MKIIQQTLERDNFTCQKCGFKGKPNELEIHHIKLKSFEGKDKIENLITLCSICHKYAPDNEIEFKKYIQKKINGKILDTFRKSNYSISRRTKFGMQRKAKEGGFITKAPKGYKLIDKTLVLSENSKEIQKIFQEFLDSDISLTQLAKKNSMTPTGMKKLLRNITYLGKVKFDNEISDGTHPPLIDAILFNKVQDKIKELGWS
jgi:hypothetical protein